MTKRPFEEDIREIDINSLEIKVRREVEEKIFIYELMGFEPLSLLESSVDNKSRGYVQVMINRKLGILLSLVYGIFANKYSKYTDIEIEYLSFEFENLDKELIHITNHKGNKLPSQNFIKKYFIDFEDDFSFQSLILDISKSGMIDKNSVYIATIQDNVLKSTKVDTIIEKDFLLQLGYFIKKRDYLTLSIKASCSSIFKEIYPLKLFFNNIEKQKSKIYFESKGIFLEKYYDVSESEEYDKKIKNLKDLKKYFNTNKKYIEISKKYQLEKIEFSFYEEFDDLIESKLDILQIDIELTAKKELSNNRCLYNYYRININNEEQTSSIFYDKAEIYINKCQKIDVIANLDNCVEIKKIQSIIYRKYKESIIKEISLAMFDNRLSYIASIYKSEIEEETLNIYLGAITAKIFLEE